MLQLPGEPDETPVLLYGVIDRIDRHADGTIEIIDYKTGRSKNQADVDRTSNCPPTPWPRRWAPSSTRPPSSPCPRRRS